MMVSARCKLLLTLELGLYTVTEAGSGYTMTMGPGSQTNARVAI